MKAIFNTQSIQCHLFTPGAFPTLHRLVIVHRYRGGGGGVDGQSLGGVQL